MNPRRVWLTAFVVVLVAGQAAVGMRASRTASVTGDEPFYLATAQSLQSDGDLDLRDEYARGGAELDRFWDGSIPLWKQMVPAPDGRLVAPHDPGLPLLITPAYAVAGLEGARRFLVVLWSIAMAFAAVLAMRAGAPAWAALVASVAVGAGAPGIVYASQIYPEGPAALCVVLGLMLASGKPVEAGEPRWWLRSVAVVAVLGALVWLGTKYAIVGGLLFAVWAWRHRGSRRVLVLATATAVVLAAHFAWWHVRVFGGLTPYATNVVWAGDGGMAILADHLDLDGRSYRLYGLFLDARFGLFRWSPVAVVAAWGVTRRTLVHTGVLAVAVLVGTFLSITMMGWWFPGRMLVAALPALAVLVATGAARLRAPALALAAWSVAVGGAVAVAARTGRIRLAVDPFDLGAPLPPAQLFPDFRNFGAREVVTALAWGAAVLGLRRVAGRPVSASGIGSGRDGQAPPPRRQLPRLPRLLRAADRHGDGVRAGDQRSVRVHLDAHQPAEGPPS